MKSRFLIIECAGYIFWQLFLWRLYVRKDQTLKNCFRFMFSFWKLKTLLKRLFVIYKYVHCTVYTLQSTRTSYSVQCTVFNTYVWRLYIAHINVQCTYVKWTNGVLVSSLIYDTIEWFWSSKRRTTSSSVTEEDVVRRNCLAKSCPYCVRNSLLEDQNHSIECTYTYMFMNKIYK